jgi:hypothetical protein
MSDLKQGQSYDLSLRLISAVSKNNLLERLLKDEALEELNQLSITRQTVNAD